jgi:hypothetical protein
MTNEIKLIALLEQLLAELRQRNGIVVPPKLPRQESDAEWNLLKRRMLVKQNPDLSAPRLCALFDVADIPTSEEWNVASWAAAYRMEKHRKAIASMITRDRTAARMTRAKRKTHAVRSREAAVSLDLQPSETRGERKSHAA